MWCCLLLGSVALLACHATPASGKVASVRSNELGPFGYLAVPPPPATSRAGTAETLWFNDQRLDHFDKSNNVTWKQRYFRNTGNHVAGGPVLLFINGESEANSAWVTAGNMARTAEIVGALCLSLEHRFYGLSRPTLNVTTESLRYLSAQQALKDVENFVRWYRQQNQNVSTVPWVVFGGSYAGALAAWARLSFPELITGAVASSAPVQVSYNFTEYLETVGDDLAASDAACLQDVRDAVAEFQQLAQTQTGVEKISQYYNVCTTLNISQPSDVATVQNQIQLLFSGIAQSSSKTVPDELHQQCAKIRELSGSPLQRMAQVTLQKYNGKCFNGRLSGLTNALTATDYSALSRQWTYQTCSQFGYYQTMDSQKQPFGHSVTAEYYAAICTTVFGSQFSLEYTRQAAATMNAQYGGRNTNVTNVAFVNGGQDPWHRLSVVRNISSSTIAIYIPDTAHCTDQLSDNLTDSPTLRFGRAQIREFVANITGRRRFAGFPAA